MARLWHEIAREASAARRGHKPKRVLAVGESQSAGRLVTYVDAVHPLAEVYDGFLVAADAKEIIAVAEESDIGR